MELRQVTKTLLEGNRKAIGLVMGFPFAIAITLLTSGNKNSKTRVTWLLWWVVFRYLVHLWPRLSYFSLYCKSSIHRVNYHWLFTFVNKTDHIFNLLLNIVFNDCVIYATSPAYSWWFYFSDEYKMPLYQQLIVLASNLIPVGFIVYLYAVHKHRLVPKIWIKKFINAIKYKLVAYSLLNSF